MSEQRYSSLDSIRGIAALIVVFNHVFNGFHGDWHHALLKYTPLGALVNGRLAVIIFFVLSGFVLSASIGSTRTTFHYPQYVLRRLTRIYLPFVVALLIATLTAALIAFPPDAWRASESDWTDPPRDVFLSHLLMTGINYSSISLLPPMWTLIQEIRIGILVPVIYFVLRAFGLRALVLWALVALLSAKIPGFMGSIFADKISVGIIESLLLNVYYSAFFFVGSYTYLKRQAIVSFLIEKVKPEFAVAAVFILWFIVPRALPDSSFLAGDIYYGVVAFMVVATCISFDVKMLGNSIVMYLGKISYSLYLTHVIAIFSARILLYPMMPLWAASVIGGIVSIGFAHVFYKVVEVPAHKLSRRIKAGSH